MEGKIAPLSDWCLIEREVKDDRSSGGIIMPDEAKEEKLRGTVRAVGPGRRDDRGEIVPMQVKVGDLVLFPRYSPYGVPEGFIGDAAMGVELGDPEADLILVREIELLAVIVE